MGAHYAHKIQYIIVSSAKKNMPSNKYLEKKTEEVLGVRRVHIYLAKMRMRFTDRVEIDSLEACVRFLKLKIIV